MWVRNGVVLSVLTYQLSPKIILISHNVHYWHKPYTGRKKKPTPDSLCLIQELLPETKLCVCGHSSGDGHPHHPFAVSYMGQLEMQLLPEGHGPNSTK